MMDTRDEKIMAPIFKEIIMYSSRVTDRRNNSVTASLLLQINVEEWRGGVDCVEGRWEEGNF